MITYNIDKCGNFDHNQLVLYTYKDLIFLMEKWSESWLKESLNIHTTHLRTHLILVVNL